MNLNCDDCRQLLREKLAADARADYYLIELAEIKNKAGLFNDADVDDKVRLGRFKIAAALRSGRRRLLELRKRINKEERRLDEQLQKQCAAHDEFLRVFVRQQPPEYPAPPPPTIQATLKGEHLPAWSGVYFIWSAGKIAYVGQSVNIAARVRLSHEAIHVGNFISWLPFPQDELNWAEAFYISAYRPYRNFGKGGIA